MKNLLVKLGFLKLTYQEYLYKLEIFVEQFSESILTGSRVECKEKEKSKSEVRIFLWLYIIPILREKLNDELFHKTMTYFAESIIFKGIKDLSDEEKSSLIVQRGEIHNIGLERLADGDPSYYLKQLDLMFHLRPFYHFQGDNSAFPISFDPIRNTLVLHYFHSMFKNLMPIYVNFVEDMSSKIKVK